MNKKAFLPLSLLIGLGFFLSFKLIADRQSMTISEPSIEIAPYSPPSNAPSNLNQSTMYTIMQVLQEGHYSPKNLDDTFSQKVYTKYLEFSDYGKMFFTQEDINEFKIYEYRIDDDIRDGSIALYEKVSSRLGQRIKEAEAYYKEALETPFSFDTPEEIELDGKKLNWATNQQTLKERWTKTMKYRTLARFAELKEQQEKKDDKKEDKKNTKPDEVVVKSDTQLEVDARESVKKNMQSYFKRLYKISETDRFATFMNSICRVVDPHTDFFPPKDKQRFNEEMSGSFYGIGAQLSVEDGNCKVKQVIVGAPAWKEGRLKNEDIILKVAQADEEPVEITGWDIEEVVQIIRGKEGTEVRLTVKHLAGNIEIISIRRGKVETESTFAKSAIIKQNGADIGYILLPEFYAPFNDPRGRRCSEDIAKEIAKLKAENVQGIIFDLRSNGGGSLSDVVDIAGMFIDRGPVVQVKSRNAPAQSLNDRVAGTLYDGPLAILVSQASASASEILAAAMQDYHRGIIIGGTTFGKGTVQRVYDLQEFYRGDPSLNPPGSIKLTLQKFYRINGGSTQLKGVTPDIKLPDAFALLDIGERKDENSLPWDQIAQADYSKLKSQVDFSKLAELSSKRVNQNEAFKLITQNAERLKKQNDDNRYSLLLSRYKEQIKESKDLAKKLDEVNNIKVAAVATNLKADLPTINLDTVSIKRNEEWLKNLKKDAYVNEAANVILDWIRLSKS